jgi:DNA-binding transcriptional regulator YiaG
MEAVFEWDNAKAERNLAKHRMSFEKARLFGRRVRQLREKLGLSQKEFAERFDINLRRLQDWEQGRFAPDSVALAYLRVIEQAPDLVRRILQAV